MWFLLGPHSPSRLADECSSCSHMAFFPCTHLFAQISSPLKNPGLCQPLPCPTQFHFEASPRFKSFISKFILRLWYLELFHVNSWEDTVLAIPVEALGDVTSCHRMGSYGLRTCCNPSGFSPGYLDPNITPHCLSLLGALWCRVLSLPCWISSLFSEDPGLGCCILLTRLYPVL